ncbi:MAG TPA: hypothetical protein VHX90_03695, partial [Verrucomicrobiae bacterium]|nr:hypothetical protein [Verrucomicrobiae bacterium]
MKKIIFIFAFVVMAAIGAFAQFGFLDKLQGITNSSANQDSKISSIKNIFSSTGKALKGLTGIGLQEELTIGNSVAIQIVAKYGGLVRDEAITTRVNLVGKSLAYYCDRPELDFHFGVLNSPTVNAFSAPGG